jgi:hypothetical protein
MRGMPSRHRLVSRRQNATHVRGQPYQIDMLDVASHRRTPLFKHPVYNLLYGHFSPDGRWVSFTVRVQPNRSRIVIAPVDEPKPVPESAWIKITEEGAEDWADWSPDGRTLYFTSERDGHTCLWGQRIEVNSHRPSGEAFVIKHFHGRTFYPQGGVGQPPETALRLCFQRILAMFG